MSYIHALVAAVIGALLGLAGGIGLGFVLAWALDVPDREGASAYFVAFIGLIGGGIGLVATPVWWMRRRGRNWSAVVPRLAASLAILAGLVVLAVGTMYLLDDKLVRNEVPPRLVFELRLPPGAKPVTATDRIELHTANNAMPGQWRLERSRVEGDRIVVVGDVEMFFRTSQRLLMLRRTGGPDVVFDVRVGRSAGHSDTFSSWKRAEHVFDPGRNKARPTRAGAEENYEIRYRARWAGRD